MDKLRIELVWNREFDWSIHMYTNDLETAKQLAIVIRDSEDGERVKKIRIVDNETDEVLWRG